VQGQTDTKPQNVSGNGRTPEPSLRHLTKQQQPGHRKKNSQPTFGTFGFAPTHKANASQNQKSQTNQNSTTIPNYPFLNQKRVAFKEHRQQSMVAIFIHLRFFRQH